LFLININKIISLAAIFGFQAFCARAAFAEEFTTIAECKHWISEAAATNCIDKALDFARRNSASPKDLEKSAKYIEEFDQASSAIVYEMIISASAVKVSSCKRLDAQRAAMAGLRSRNEKASESSAKIAETCFTQMEAGLKSGLSENYAPYMKTICPLMDRKKAIKSLVRKKCEPFLK
jgi:hypothetical protein